MKNLEKYNFITINILFFLFPLSVILGNLFINLNIVLFCVCALIFYHKKKIKFNINFLDKIILVFFLYTFITLIINLFESYINGEIYSKIIISKTLLYLRYLIFYLTLRFLLNQKILRLDWFSFACAICAAFVCFDIFFQFTFGKNLFGIEVSSSRHFSGVFGEELIAGGYLSKFALFIFFLPFVLNKKIFYRVLIQIIIFVIFMFGINFSGNKMPLVLFVFSFFAMTILDKSLRKHIFKIIMIVLVFIILNWNSSQTFRHNAGNTFFHAVNAIHSFIYIKDITTLPMEITNKPYVLEFFCFKYMWKKNPIFGGGLKSYRTQDPGCNIHPHNYYFEILTDLGLVGLTITLFFIFTLLRKIFINKNTSSLFSLGLLDSRIMPFFLIFLIEFFPFRTSGSFFSTGNASIIFLILAVLISLISEKKKYNYLNQYYLYFSSILIHSFIFFILLNTYKCVLNATLIAYEPKHYRS